MEGKRGGCREDKDRAREKEKGVSNEDTFSTDWHAQAVKVGVFGMMHLIRPMKGDPVL